ncbi:MAG TPA: hypothetical protein QF753_02095 [Victivallales bacterium]|nr:hypothetical protein [Victivallales bacterium]
MKNFLSTKEITEITNKSYPTINRWVNKVKKDKDLNKYTIVEKELNKNIVKVDIELVKKNFVLNEKYKNNQVNNQKDNTTVRYDAQNDNDLANVNGNESNQKDNITYNLLERNRESNVLLKSNSDTIKELQDTVKKLLEPSPFYRLTTFWLSVGFIILFIAVCGIGYLYLTETKAEYNNNCATLVDQVKDIKAHNQVLILSYEKKILELKNDNKVSISKMENSHNDYKQSNQVLIKQYLDIISELKKESRDLKNILSGNNKRKTVKE